LLGTSLWCQTGTSTVRGGVTDPHAAVIPKATVTLKNQGTGFERSQVANNAGRFSFELIPPGDYTLEVAATGFQKKVVSNIHALVGSAVETNVSMEIGALQQTVMVESVPTEVAINTQDASLGNNFVSQQIIELPLEARDISTLLTLQPAVTRDGF